MADGSATDELKQQYAIHKARKTTAREEKERDKQLAKANTNIHLFKVISERFSISFF